MGKFKEIAGQVFGKLTVCKFAYTKDSRAYWECKCECGNISIVSGKELRSGHTKSCGCIRNPNLTDKIFGNLHAIKIAKKLHDTFWLCKCKCGTYIEITTSNLTTGNTKSCGCLKQQATTARNKNAAFNNRNYPQWFIDEIYYDEDKKRAINNELISNDKIYFKCAVHEKYSQLVSDHIRLATGERKFGCAECSNHIASLGSRCENEIKDYIGLMTTEEISKMKLLDILDGNNKKEIDIYIKELNIGVEYNESTFHGTKGSQYKDKPKLYHQAKFLAAKAQGIHLINIFDVDWTTNEDKIKMYLKSLFVKSKKVFARKCIIKLIDRKLANEFTDKYHIQGKARLSSINYGLYYNGELVSVMSFGCLRLQKNEVDKYELHRYCVKDGYTIVGGASRLLKAFEREYSPKYLLSFSDNDYFMGGIYEMLNFENSGQSTPRYYWFYKNKEIKRERCQLKHLKIDYPELLQEAYNNEASNKEDYVMLKLGATKVYRSGNTKWEKYYK